VARPPLVLLVLLVLGHWTHLPLATKAPKASVDSLVIRVLD
jgi:hypothetical protein